MKKALFFLAMLPLILFSACSDDNENVTGLNGTIWEYNDGKYYKTILSFWETSFEMKSSLDIDEDGVFEISTTDKGTYEMNGYDLYFNSNDIDIKSARIDGDLIYIQLDESTDNIIFHKK
ncbi:hypothetical protein KGH46_12310 [Bacteroides thetaiotaomicron]|uniref:hypothetical protein n=1 Tax=Bacteroides thetaiotaomicron TaxID=818 RepID=UPI001CE33023|nr:hypothetical protein [Bacteroides thetaiotaomicron]MCA6036979.1 hypothetical protein [Bacteroides thetaiotaomicron]